ncbi:hypothetical protein ACFVDI_02530 [Nocardioides sp. NPDC057767]
MNHRTARRKGKENYAKFLLATALNTVLGALCVTYAYLNSATYYVG